MGDRSTRGRRHRQGVNTPHKQRDFCGTLRPPRFLRRPHRAVHPARHQNALGRIAAFDGGCDARRHGPLQHAAFASAIEAKFRRIRQRHAQCVAAAAALHPVALVDEASFKTLHDDRALAGHMTQRKPLEFATQHVPRG